MRYLFVALLACFGLLSNPAYARHHHYHHHYRSHVHYASYERDDYHYHYRREGGGGLSEPCQVARSLGGPCGCFASELIFGHTVRNLWTAASWFQFPRTEPRPGAAAVRPHHVVIVVANNGDGTVTVHDSWGIHRQSVHGWTFVDPHGSASPRLLEANYRSEESYSDRRPTRRRHYRSVGRAFRPDDSWGDRRWNGEESKDYGGSHTTMASWYAGGRYTASGERYNPDGLTAASRTLPIGSHIRVRYHGRSVVVRINDRGPWVRDRGLDLSRGAAKAIGLDRAGTGRVSWDRER